MQRRPEAGRKPSIGGPNRLVEGCRAFSNGTGGYRTGPASCVQRSMSVSPAWAHRREYDLNVNGSSAIDRPIDRPTDRSNARPLGHPAQAAHGDPPIGGKPWRGGVITLNANSRPVTNRPPSGAAIGDHTTKAACQDTASRVQSPPRNSTETPVVAAFLEFLVGSLRRHHRAQKPSDCI